MKIYRSFDGRRFQTIEITHGEEISPPPCRCCGNKTLPSPGELADVLSLNANLLMVYLKNETSATFWDEVVRLAREMDSF